MDAPSNPQRPLDKQKGRCNSDAFCQREQASCHSVYVLARINVDEVRTYCSDLPREIVQLVPTSTQSRFFLHK